MTNSTDETSIYTPSDATLSVSASIVQIYGPDLGLRRELERELTIGRGDENAVQVDLTSVSRRHARLFERDGAWHVEDLGSTNGTFVNDVEAEAVTPLANGDLVKVGAAVFKFIEGGNVEALYHEEIYRLTIIDGLTRVHNRRYFTDLLERETARAERRDRPLSVALLDIDHFKRINDAFGHLAGDHVLQVLAGLIEQEMRKEELFARYGGEEFAFILPDADHREAMQFCERIRALVEAHTFAFDGREIPVTVSIGVASKGPQDAMGQLVAAADRHLYAAKEAGRNRVHGELAAVGPAPAGGDERG